jgi:hypothetical protein
VEDTYHGVLQVAIEAAREAGSLPRQDLLKPGGPSGHDGHAEADEPAERLICQPNGEGKNLISDAYFKVCSENKEALIKWIEDQMKPWSVFGTCTP